MLKAVNHIGIAVKDLEKSIETYAKIFNCDNFHKETILEQKVNVASFKVGDVLIELTSPTDETSPIAKFIEKRGEGIHHIAFESTDISADLDSMKQKKVQLINESPQHGAHNMLIAFVHPKSTHGVLMEVCQHN